MSINSQNLTSTYSGSITSLTDPKLYQTQTQNQNQLSNRNSTPPPPPTIQPIKKPPQIDVPPPPTSYQNQSPRQDDLPQPPIQNRWPPNRPVQNQTQSSPAVLSFRTSTNLSPSNSLRNPPTLNFPSSSSPNLTSNGNSNNNNELKSDSNGTIPTQKIRPRPPSSPLPPPPPNSSLPPIPNLSNKPNHLSTAL